MRDAASASLLIVQYVLPLLDVIKAVPEYNNASWLLRYQMTTLLETYKRLL